jgi:hypothetical protein
MPTSAATEPTKWLFRLKADLTTLSSQKLQLMLTVALVCELLRSLCYGEWPELVYSANMI